MQQQEAGPPEPGFFTVAQWEKKLHRKSAQTRLLCRMACEAGEMERKMFRVDTVGGKRPVPHYRIIQPVRSKRGCSGTAS